MNNQCFRIIILLATVMVGPVHADMALMLAELSLDDAVKQVIDGNRLLDAETKYIDDREVHVIKVLTEDGRVQKHKVDAQTGERLGKGKR